MKWTKKSVDDLSYKIIGAAIEVHKELGPGLLEKVYERCLIYELKKIGFEVKNQLKIPVKYKGITIDAGLRLDLLIEDCIIVELKAVENMYPIFEAQLLTYMKLLEKPKGILINFNTTNIAHEGKATRVNEIYAALA